MATIDERSVLRSLVRWNAAPGGPLVGTWKLVSCEARRRTGQVIQLYGPEPQGRLFYDAAGNMSVQVMGTGRPAFHGDQKLRGTDDELRAAYESYEAYFSTYDVDWERGVINHRVLGSLFPNWIGSQQPRYFRLDGPDRLILRTHPFDSIPRRTVVTLVWERIA